MAMGTRLNLLSLLGAPLMVGAVGWGPAASQELDLDALIDEALRNNPELGVLKHRWEGFEARVPRAGAPQDPAFRFDLLNLPSNALDFDRTPMSGKMFTFSQQIPFPGKLAAKERMAQHAAAAALASFQDREGKIVSLVKRAYLSLAFLDRAIGITQKNEALLKDIVRIAQTKYAVGRGLQQDVLKAQVSRSELIDRLVVLKSRRRMTEARLNLVLNRLPQKPVGVPGKVVLTPFEMPLEKIQQIALARRPLLRGIESRIRKWEASEHLASRQSWPNFDFSVSYRQRALSPGDPVEGSDFFSLGIGMDLPIYAGRKQRQRVLEAQANLRMAEAQRQAARQRILFQVQTLYLEIEQHRAEAELFRTAILQQAEQSLESAMAGYQVDKVDFLTLSDNQLTLFNFEIDYFRHVIGHERQLAELEAVVGKRLFSRLEVNP